jgi:hypothetical protein
MRKEKRKDVTKLTVAYRNFANVPKKTRRAEINKSVFNISKLVLEARPEGGRGRGRGRPRLEWEEYVERLACKRGRKLPEVKRLAQNRKEYRKWLLEPDA